MVPGGVEPATLTEGHLRLSLSIKRLAALKSIFSFELIFTLFVFSSRIKADDRLMFLPIDLTLLAFMLSVIAGVYVVFKHRLKIFFPNKVALLSASALAVYIVVSLGWSKSNTYAQEKTFAFISLTVWCFIGAYFIISPSRKRLDRFIGYFTSFGILFVLEGLFAINKDGGFIGAFGGNYIGTGRIVGPVLIFSIMVICFDNRGRWLGKVFFSSLAVLSGVLMLNAGARGPLLGVVFSLMCTFLFLARWTRPSLSDGKRVAYVLIIISGLALYILSKGQGYEQMQTIRRLYVLAEEGMGSSAGARLAHYMASVHMWAEQPFLGQGIGSWPVLAMIGDRRGYPHNIFIESLVELGVIGTLILFLFLCSSLLNRPVLQALKKRDARALYIWCCAVFFIFNALLSGDLNDNRYVFLFLGISSSIFAFRDSSSCTRTGPVQTQLNRFNSGSPKGFNG